MELLTIWDSKRLIVRIATIIQADVMIVFLNTVKNVLSIVRRRDIVAQPEYAELAKERISEVAE